MPKDPAILFYYQDFIFGTSFMTNEQVGAYIRILSYLADKGNLKEEHIKTICKTQEVFKAVIEKLERNGDDSYHQKRLTEEVIKRRKYTEGRRKNLTNDKEMSPHMDAHMEDVNEDINVIIKEKEQKFKSEVLKFNYPKDMLNEFILYWTEPNKSRTKLRYELQNTWDTSRRLGTWAKNNKQFTKKEPERKVYKSSNFDEVVKDDNITPGEMPDYIKHLAGHKTVK